MSLISVSQSVVFDSKLLFASVVSALPLPFASSSSLASEVRLDRCSLLLLLETALDDATWFDVAAGVVADNYEEETGTLLRFVLANFTWLGRIASP